MWVVADERLPDQHRQGAHLQPPAAGGDSGTTNAATQQPLTTSCVFDAWQAEKDWKYYSVWPEWAETAAWVNNFEVRQRRAVGRKTASPDYVLTQPRHSPSVLVVVGVVLDR